MKDIQELKSLLGSLVAVLVLVTMLPGAGVTPEPITRLQELATLATATRTDVM